MGFDLTPYLVYETTKRVRIFDRKLACVYLSLCLAVACWVVGFQIFYGNEHFQRYDVHGNARVTIQQPTKGCNPNDVDCEDDFKPLTELPYCEKYEGKPRPDIKHQRRCIFADQHELQPDGMLYGNMFIPTRIDGMTEERTCDPGPDNGYSCTKAWTMTEHHENTYVADIEDYTVMMVSTYYRDEIRNSSLAHQGFYYECRDTKSGKIIATEPCHGELNVVPIQCLPGLDCGYSQMDDPPRVSFTEVKTKVQHQQLRDRGVAGRAAASMHRDTDAEEASAAVLARGNAQLDVFAIPGAGDIFRLSKLLALAGLELDGSPNDEGETLRERGTILAVEIEYANLKPFKSTGALLQRSHTTPGYIYKVVERPMFEMKTEMYSKNKMSSDKLRYMENRHGILLRVQVSGSFGKFSIVYLLVMLTTSVALLGAASKLTDFLAIYVLEGKEDYTEAKYQKYPEQEKPSS